MSANPQNDHRFGEAASIFIAFLIVSIIVGGLAFLVASEPFLTSSSTARSSDHAMVFWTGVIACFTAVSAVVSILAVVILRATLVETQKAVRETSEATKEMIRANKIAEGSRRDLIRPVIKVSSNGPYVKEHNLGLVSASGEWPRTIPLHVFVQVENIGATDAIIEKIEFDFSSPAPAWDADVLELNRQHIGTHLVSQGPPVEIKFVSLIQDLTEERYWQIKSDPPYLLAKIFYRDVVFGVLREKSFSYRPSTLWSGDVKPFGSAELNYDKEHTEQ